MEHFRTAIFITISLIVTASAIQKDHCLEYKLGNCIKCDEESNLAQGRCMENEVDCMTTQKINSENIKIENYPANGTYISPKSTPNINRHHTEYNHPIVTRVQFQSSTISIFTPPKLPSKSFLSKMRPLRSLRIVQPLHQQNHLPVAISIDPIN